MGFEGGRPASHDPSRGCSSFWATTLDRIRLDCFSQSFNGIARGRSDAFPSLQFTSLLVCCNLPMTTTLSISSQNVAHYWRALRRVHSLRAVRSLTAITQNREDDRHCHESRVFDY